MTRTNDYARELGRRIKTARCRAGLRQVDLARATGKIGIGNYECGANMPSIATLSIISQATGTSLDDLVPPAALRRTECDG